MIAGHFHKGSGIGNQLHRYVMTRVLALDKGFDFGMYGEHKMKDFMSLDIGKPVEGIMSHFFEKRIDNEQGVDIRTYDWSIREVEDNTAIDGEFQGEDYFMHRVNEIREWLKVTPLEIAEDVCVINFRGGEYVGVKDLFLGRDYWEFAISMMREINPNMLFEVHTDDPTTASQFFPNFHIISDAGINWRSIRYAKYLILSNSSFAILPTLLNEHKKKVIAPKYWARHNLGFWALPYNEYKGWHYI